MDRVISELLLRFKKYLVLFFTCTSPTIGMNAKEIYFHERFDVHVQMLSRRQQGILKKKVRSLLLIRGIVLTKQVRYDWVWPAGLDIPWEIPGGN